MHLFLKVERFSSRPRVIAWNELTHRARSLGPRVFNMTYSEAGEFEYLRDHAKDKCVGAGGQFEYRSYALVVPPAYPYAIVYPASAAVQAQYPEACRLVDLRTAEESALFENRDAAIAAMNHAVTGRLKGPFGAVAKT